MARSRWSLERRLPLLILALLVCVVGGFSVAAYREVRSSAIRSATDRLERVARELTATSSRSAQPRLASLRTLAGDSAVVDAVLAPTAETWPTLDGGTSVPVPRSGGPTTAVSAQVATVLGAAGRPADSTLLRRELWTVDGERRYGSANGGGVRDSLALVAARAAAERTGSVEHSPLFAVDSVVRMWTVVPVRANGSTVGFLAELRRLSNSARAEETIRQLTGVDVRVLFTSRGGDEWASLRGTPVPAPFSSGVREDVATRVVARDRAPHYVVQSAVPGTPWRIVLLQPEASVLRRPHEFLRSLLGVGAVLLALGTVGAWLLGRHVARPLRRLTDAADALARGDYAQRVGATGAHEVVSLAATFNAMAARLGDAHTTLAERNADLQRANDAKGQFLAMMSHELRTPLNAIGGYTELIELGLRGPVTPGQIEDLGRIRRNKDHLLSIIADILNFARADAGALALTPTDVHVADVLGETADALGPQFQAKGVRLLSETVPSDAVLRGDREKVQQIVFNLVANALKFTEPNGTVVLSTRVDADTVRLDVRDTGVGIPADRLDDIFEPFVQVDGSLTRSAGGTGLGLAIARMLATAMGGRVEVVSSAGRGSVFTLVLPTRDAADSPASSRHVEPPPRAQVY